MTIDLPDTQAVECDSARFGWPCLLPRDGDSEEERQHKRRQVLKALRVKNWFLDGARVRAQQPQRVLPGLLEKQAVAQLGSTQQRSPDGSRSSQDEGNSQPANEEQQPDASCRSAAAEAVAEETEEMSAEEVGAALAGPPPEPAAPAEQAEEEGAGAAEGFHTPLMARMLPGPGRGAGRQQGGSATAAGDSGARSPLAGSAATSALPSTSGIPTVSTGGLETAAWGAADPEGTEQQQQQQQQQAARRRRPRMASEPALASGRLPLSAGGFLTGLGPREEGPPSSSTAGEQQPRGRRWKAPNPLSRLMNRQAAVAASQQQQQQQQQQQGAVSQQGLADSGLSFQPTRPSRFAPEAAGASMGGGLAGASASLTTQIGGSQPLDVRPSMDPEQLRLAEQQLLRPIADLPAPAQQQQQAEQAAQAPQQQQEEPAQTLQQAASAPQQQQAEPAIQQQQSEPAIRQQQSDPAPAHQQLEPASQQQQHVGPVHGLAPGRPLGAAGGATAATVGTGTFGTNWTLPPTPSCIYALSPDSPAGQAAGQAAGGAAGGGAGSSVKPARPGSGRTAFAGGSSAQPETAWQHRSEPPQPGSAAPIAAPGADPGTLALRRLPRFSCAAETPQLSLGSQAQQLQQQTSVDGEARQLFVAETPSDAAAAATASGTAPSQGAAEQQQQLLGQQAAAAAAAIAREAAAAAAAAAAEAAGARGEAATAVPLPAAAAATAAVGVSPAPYTASAAAAIGLQLQLPHPVLQVAPCSDGRHLALLLGSYGPSDEPQHVMVLQLPAEPAESAAPQPGVPQQQAGGSCCGVRVVASLAVERSGCGMGVPLGPCCIQLASTEKAGLLLILSAVLQLSEHPSTSYTHGAILVLSLSALASGGGGASSGPRGPTGRGGARRRQLPGLLAIEYKYPLTAVALAGGCSMYASGYGPNVCRIDFDPLWRSYTWHELPAAYLRTSPFEDVAHMQPYRHPEHPYRQLLLGIGSRSGALAIWDAESCQLLLAKNHSEYLIRSLQPVSMQQAGLSSPAKRHVTAAEAAAAATEAFDASDGPHLFVGRVEHRQTRKQHVAAVMLSAGSLLISSKGAVVPAAPLRPEAGRQAAAAQQQQEQQQQVTAVAPAPGGRFWLGTAGGELLSWDPISGSIASEPGGRVPACSSRSAVSCACSMPGGGGWGTVAGTANGSCTILART